MNKQCYLVPQLPQHLEGLEDHCIGHHAGSNAESITSCFWLTDAHQIESSLFFLSQFPR